MIRLPALLATICTFSVTLTTGSQAADPANGRELARKCTVCHGKLGVGRDPEVPHLAGQPAFYLEKSLTDYKTGKRKDRRMTLMVKPLSKSDIKDLAAWYASVKIEVKDPDKH